VRVNTGRVSRHEEDTDVRAHCLLSMVGTYRLGQGGSKKASKSMLVTEIHQGPGQLSEDCLSDYVWPVCLCLCLQLLSWPLT
jgi:hypothetical protein